MRKLSMVAAILLLSSAWVFAQSGASPSSDQNPSSSSPSQTSPSSTSPSSQQPAQQPDTSSQSSSSASANTVEGCVGGSAGNFTLTDASG
jgi:cytoskeletal protein RodZ